MSARGSFTPVKAAGTVYPLSTAGITAGVAAHFGLGDTSLAIEPCLEAGANYLFSTKNWAHDSWGVNVLTDVSLAWQLTRNFAFRGTAGFQLISCPSVKSAFTLGVGSVATF